MQRINLFSLFPLKWNCLSCNTMVTKTKSKQKVAAVKKKKAAKKTAAKKTAAKKTSKKTKPLSKSEASKKGWVTRRKNAKK